jgi:hypothetical protein
VFKSPIYEYINVAQDPQLRYVVLAGLLNVSTCPNCGRRAAVSHPFIYSDPVHNLLAYVDPRTDVPEEARLLILERLRSVYTTVTTAQEQQIEYSNGSSEQTPTLHSHTQTQTNEVPPLRVVFGLDQFTELLNTLLGSDERLGRLSLSTQSRDEAERGQFLTVARKLATEMGCIVEVEDLPDEYTIWLYGSRRQIGALVREFARRG